MTTSKAVHGRVVKGRIVHLAGEVSCKDSVGGRFDGNFFNAKGGVSERNGTGFLNRDEVRASIHDGSNRGSCLRLWVNGRMMEGVRCVFMVDGLALSEAVQTTFITSGTATLLAMMIGVPLGAWCARQKRPSFQRLKTLITALYGLPPVVVGVFVYSLFSKSGALGSLDLLFTVQAMIFAQTCLILPLVWGGSGPPLRA